MKLSGAQKHSLFYFLVGVTILISINSTENILTSTALYYLLALSGLTAVRGQVEHPITVFTLVFSIYVSSYVYLTHNGLLNDIGVTKDVVFSHSLALFTFSIFVVNSRIPKNIRGMSNMSLKNNIKSLERPSLIVFYILSGLGILYLIFVIKSGYINKHDLKNSTNPLLYLSFVFLMSSTAMIYYQAERKIKYGKWDKKHLYLYIVLLSLVTLVSGERVFLFKFLISFAILFFFLSKKNGFFVIVTSILLGLTVFTYIKLIGGYFISGNISDINKPLLEMVLYSEFKTSGRITAELLNGVQYYEFGKGHWTLMDLYRSVVPGFLYAQHIETASLWNSKFFFEDIYESVGVGFSMVGFGYLEYGYIGIAMLFSAIGLFCKYLYRKSSSGIISLVLYVSFISILVTSIRFSLAALVSQTLKHLLLVLLIILITKKILSLKSSHS